MENQLVLKQVPTEELERLQSDLEAIINRMDELQGDIACRPLERVVKHVQTAADTIFYMIEYRK